MVGDGSHRFFVALLLNKDFPMIALNVNSIRESQKEFLDQIDVIAKVAEDEGRDLTPEEKTECQGLLEQHDALTDDLKLAMKREAARADLEAASGRGVPSAQIMTDAMQRGQAVLQQRQMRPAGSWTRSGLRAFNWHSAHRDNEQEAYDAGMWIAATHLPPNESFRNRAIEHCKDRGIRLDAQTLDDDTKGGYLATSSMTRAIIRIVDEAGIARQVCDVRELATETDDIPKRSGGLTVYAPAEAAEITTSEMTWGNVPIVTRDRATLSKISRKALRAGSTITNIADRVAEEIGYAFAYQQDKELIDGDGSSVYFNVVGLEAALGTAGINTTATTSEDTWGELTLANHWETMAKLPAKFWRRRPMWICSPAYYFAVMARLMAAGGGNTIATLQSGTSDLPGFFGYPVLFTVHTPQATAVSTIHAFFGNYYDGVILGDRVDTEIAQSEHAYFTSNSVAVRGTISYDIKVHEGGDASNAGAYVALKTGAAS